ncbi:helix-turn-helix domain-containing protein [Phytomonospora endophytica]|uniref:helix-turn-helix domain-containing protein n=1 Tax=Phytomonospora endophytica TaxID=714109 RepID=UPI001A5FA0DA|nr:hypothetical protein Pen01_55490 [Phytomonospora endophytica]
MAWFRRSRSAPNPPAARRRPSPPRHHGWAAALHDAAIARRVGYSSQYTFTHAFKRRFGSPPGRYRDRAD